MSFTDKLANGIVIALIQQFNPCTLASTITCSLYYRYMLTCIPIGASVLTILMTLSMWKINIGGNRREIIPDGEINSSTTPINSSGNEYNESSPLLT
jgi:hypothetical protein